MKKIIDWFKESDRYKHFIGGAIICLMSIFINSLIFPVITAAACLELKDKLHSGKWDWTDFLITICGGILVAFVYYVIA